MGLKLVFFSITEIFNSIVLAAGIGYIFKDMFTKDKVSYTGFVIQQSPYKPYLLAIYAVFPAILIHELFHKFTALYFGAGAIFHTSYIFLAIGILLKLVGSPFLIIAPAYVAITGHITGLQSALIAFAGPFANFLLWILASIMLNPRIKAFSWVRKNEDAYTVIVAMRRINIFLAIFNIIPIPGFDGYQTLIGLIHAIG